jgi:hypothetical protein
MWRSKYETCQAFRFQAPKLSEEKTSSAEVKQDNCQLTLLLLLKKCTRVAN